MGLASAPALFNWLAILVQALPAVFLCSARSRALLPNRTARIVLALAYLLLPNTFELHANVSFAQWRLALLAFLVVVAVPPRTVWAKLFDVAAVLLSALSGPLCIFLLPVALLHSYHKKHNHLAVLTSIVAVGVVIQLAALFVIAPQARPNLEMGASILAFSKIVGGQLFLGGFFGERGFRWIFDNKFLVPELYYLGTIIISLLVIKAIFLSRWEIRLFVVYAMLVFAAALMSPTISSGQTIWDGLWGPNAACRYWFIPILATYLVIISELFSTQSKCVKVYCLILLGFGTIGMAVDFYNDPWPKQPFQRAVRDLRRAHPGEVVKFPIHPPGYIMPLRKQ